jgi:calcineurin-like phosphoesterase family protein
MSVFFTADTHFEHNKILLHAKRPWTTVGEMNEALIKRWNARVRKGDKVFILGDFCWKNSNYYLNRLHGDKIIMIGSHDHMSQEVAKNFSKVYDGAAMISVDGQPIWISHCAHRVWEKGHYGAPHFFGHSHGRLSTFNLSRDVGVDTEDSDYAPFEWPYLKEWIKTRTEEMQLLGRIVEDERGRILYRQDDVSWALNIPLTGVDQVPDGYRQGEIKPKEEVDE